MGEEIVSRTALFRAISLAGGVEPLSKAIHIPQSALLSYAADAVEIPPAVFLRLVDYVLDDAHQVRRMPWPESQGEPPEAR